MLLWRFAVAAGIAESVIGVVDAIRQEQTGAALAINIGLRIVVYGVALLLIARLEAGRQRARIAITLLLSVIGLGSMLVPAVTALIEGATFLEAVGGSGLAPTIFAVIHVAHIASVVAATVLMYLPSTSAFLQLRSRVT